MKNKISDLEIKRCFEIECQTKERQHAIISTARRCGIKVYKVKQIIKK